MHALEEMIALDLQWKLTANPVDGPTQFSLYYGPEEIAEAQATWDYLKFFDLMLWCGEGCYQVHMDLADPVRQSLAWKYGETESIAMFLVTGEGETTCNGVIKRTDGTMYDWAPTHPASLVYRITQPEVDPFLTVEGVPSFSIGGSYGHMNMGVTIAGDKGLPGLVALGFAVANEQQRLLHRPPDTRRGLFDPPEKA